MSALANIRLKDADGNTLIADSVTSKSRTLSLLDPQPGTYTIEVERLSAAAVLTLIASTDKTATAGFPVQIGTDPVEYPYRSTKDGTLTVTYVQEPGTGPVYFQFERKVPLDGFGKTVLKAGDLTRYDSGEIAPPADDRYVMANIPIERNVEYEIAMELDSYYRPHAGFSQGKLILAFTPNPK